MSSFEFAFLIYVCIFANGLTEEPAKTVVIKTKLGLIKGLHEKCPGTDKYVDEFRGIRYGKPTFGTLRFQKPQPFGGWSGTLDATEFSPACPQMIRQNAKSEALEMSEDCLALNIYVPSRQDGNSQLSVMVWIHGGALVVGHSHEYDGKQIATEGNIIVVTINYRLGVLGFFALGHPAALGNYAIWDQKMALKWTHENIDSFGGDPNSVTIFGESAGGWSVNVQSLIPSNKVLFQRAIAMSGAFDFGRMKMPSIDEQRTAALILGNKVNCTVSDEYSFIECLRKRTTQELIDATSDMHPGWQSNKLFVTSMCAKAVVDGELFKDNPFDLLKDSKSDVAKFFKSIDYVSGVTSQEGSTMLAFGLHRKLLYHFGLNVTEGISGKFACEAIVDPFVKEYFYNDASVRKKLCDFYVDKSSKDAQSLKTIQLFGDLFLTHPVVRMLDFHADLEGNTWEYLFSRASPISWGSPFPPWYTGAGHGDELYFMFPGDKLNDNDIDDIQFTKEEIDLSKKFIHCWTSFAKWGVPCKGENSIKWKKYGKDTRYFLDIGIPIKLRSNWESERVELWNNIIAQLQKIKEKLHIKDKISHIEL